MSKPVRITSHEKATTAGPGQSTQTKGHGTIGLFVTVENASVAPTDTTLEVRLEVAVDDEHYAPINYRAPTENDVFQMSGSEFIQSDADETTYVRFLSSNSFAVEHLRANIVTLDADYEVTTQVYLTGWTDRGTLYGNQEQRDVEQPYETV